ncbi:unnamed protein product [Rhizoctonia solani]|uniref:Uncharacterized protein n=1 Tax=Rhizoctonia solani TaxID=456999 RepID=A0A8H2WLG2_9AGAM|nr:unnamed protein product [Rhizoctonia solani]
MMSNVQQVLLLPEIIQKTASYCGYREQRDLAYTCRWFFSLVAPVIWKEVRGVETVIKLIPGAKVSKLYNTRRYEEAHHRNIILDESILNADWTRYWYYAPFVRHIMLSSSLQGHMGAIIQVWGWRFLFMKLQGSVLLPNLRNLDTQGLYFSSHFDRLACFVLLLSPSLQKLSLHDMSPAGPANGLPATRPLSLLLGAISKSSVADSSRIVATRDQWHPSEETLASLSPSEYPEGSFWFSNLSAPTGLRDLEITLLSPSTLWDEFCIIGFLPFLERLKTYFYIDFSKEVKYNLKTTTLPPGLFPSLRALSLNNTSHVDLFRWTWSLKTMVSRLSSAHIDLPNFGSNCQSLMVNFAQLIHDNSPSLMDLSLGLIYASREMGALEIACELLSTIPLQALTLKLDYRSVKVGDYPSAYSESTFHHLRRLHISSEFNTSDWATLPKIAKAFPNLEYLNITSSDESESYEPLDISCIDHTAFQPINIQILAQYVERSSREDEGKWEIIRPDITK